MTARLRQGWNDPLTMPPSGGAGAVRAAVRSGVRSVAESSTPVPVPPSHIDDTSLADRLVLPHLEMAAQPDSVPYARHHVRQLLWDCGLKEFIDPVELMVSEIVTNAIRASAGLTVHGPLGQEPIVRLWLSVEAHGVLILVWDGNSSRPQQQLPQPEAEMGRGLLLVEMLSAAWGSFEVFDQPGKVVWALCSTSGI